MFFLPSLLVTLICAATAAILVYTQRTKPTLATLAALTIMAITAIYLYTGFGNLQHVRKTDPEFVQINGSPNKRVYFHWHEIFHYYLGAKYFDELGYFGLYETVALADSLSDRPIITLNDMRDLRRAVHRISTKDALDRAWDEYVPKFTHERWAEFANDVEYLKTIQYDGWLNHAIYDAGYNPPPTWAVIGNTVANLMPLSDSWFDYGPTWDQSQFLPLLDLILIMISCFFIYRAFGLIGLATFLIVLGTSYIASYRWISGSFLRIQWLFGLIMGLCMLKEKRYFLAGLFMGFSAWMRIFPIVFAAGAGLSLLFDIWKNKTSLKPIRNFIAGGVLITAILLPASISMFGLDTWKDFYHNIGIHKDMNFVAHIGYRKVATFDDWVPKQNFWWGDGLDRFRDWNERLVASWKRQFTLHFPFILLLMFAAFLSTRTIPPWEASLLFGGTTLFIFAIPANYYYIYFAMLPVVMYRPETKRWQDHSLLIAFFIMWIYLYFVRTMGPDDLWHNYFVCRAILAFFVLWVGLRAFVTKNTSKGRKKA